MNGKQFKGRVHRLIIEAYYGPPNGREVNHINGDKLDNRLENLEYISVADHRRLTHNQNKGHNKKSAAKRGKAVIGVSKTGEVKEFETVQDAHRFFDENAPPKSSGILWAIKNNKRYFDWKFSYKNNDLDGEYWRKVENYPGLQQNIQVSNYGRLKTKRVTTFGNIRQGYYKFSLTINNKKVEKSVHEFVCWAFNGPKPTGTTSVNHIDNDPKNNRPENLEWSDAKAQGAHKKTMNEMKKLFDALNL